ncbi:PREDICTED: mevalonate kinase-like [Trachymyrmex septentrionalis]|uniref:mevalonate kinase-like n=1 Tax=Trachymyrmex septentrionalis TaxID=34720 RepID=UPI00084F4E65|nr:PREDICTED: mevalonate kinase-like [Trachymyrmex septentrionalis]
MYRFKVSAPGTVLLCGDCNKSCVAASLDMRTVLTFSSFPTEVVRRDFIEIKFSSIRLHMKIPLRIFLLHFHKKNYDQIYNREQLFESVKNFIKFLTGFPGNYDPDNRAHQLSLQAFFFLLVTISYKKDFIIKSSFIVELSSKLPIGEGLGSSASFVVCLAACFWRWYLLQQGTVRYIFNTIDLAHIKESALFCEYIVYTSSSLINISISTNGVVTEFNEEMSKNSFDVPSMKILLVFSNVSKKIEKSIKIIVEENLSFYVDLILNRIETISQKFIQILQKINEETVSLKQQEIVETNSVRLINYYKDLVDLIQMNQGLLKALGTSHPNIDAICSIARDSSLGAKITASCEGGYVFILLLPSDSDELDEYIQDLIKIFESHNYSTKIASLNCSGVRVE